MVRSARVKQVQTQLDQVLVKVNRENGSSGAPCALFVPETSEEYTIGKSSRGKKVIVPKWVQLGEVRYHKLARFPNAQGDVSSHAGAHGCVAAFQVVDHDVDLMCKQGLPERLALKCVPFGPKRKASESPWASEWGIHEYLRESNAYGIHDAYVRCLGGVSCQIQRNCQVFFAMELMDTDLFTMIERAPMMPDFGGWILPALYNTAKALDAMHRGGIVYCDLKPENVLVRVADGQTKFGDFDRSCVPGLKLGVVGGTKGYYSPERMRNSSLHTIADDIWAFGVLILIGCTTAASPYLDYNADNVHRFVPSKYLRRYSRCGWPQHVTDQVGMLCDRLLNIEASARIPLSGALQVLGDLLESPEMEARTAMTKGGFLASTNNNSYRNSSEAPLLVNSTPVRASGLAMLQEQQLPQQIHQATGRIEEETKAAEVEYWAPNYHAATGAQQHQAYANVSMSCTTPNHNLFDPNAYNTGVAENFQAGSSYALPVVLDDDEEVSESQEQQYVANEHRPSSAVSYASMSPMPQLPLERNYNNDGKIYYSDDEESTSLADNNSPYKWNSHMVHHSPSRDMQQLSMLSSLPRLSFSSAGATTALSPQHSTSNTGPGTGNNSGFYMSAANMAYPPLALVATANVPSSSSWHSSSSCSKRQRADDDYDTYVAKRHMYS